MGKISEVDIKGHRYRYQYNEETGATEYLGPVGDAPAISEEEFLRRVEISNKEKEVMENFRAAEDRLKHDTEALARSIEQWYGALNFRLVDVEGRPDETIQKAHILKSAIKDFEVRDMGSELAENLTRYQVAKGMVNLIEDLKVEDTMKK